MKIKLITVALLFVSLISSQARASVFLNNIYSRAVKDGQSVGTQIDSLNIEHSTRFGLAITRLTMVVTPTDFLLYENSKRVNLDSIEISLSLNLPQDYVADSMWLWVGGKPQEAYIQDRELAQAQYSQIVGQRKDPALLEYYGSGNYNLRIFPASSLKSRKISIQFHHTLFADSTNAILKSEIPFALDSTYDNSGVRVGFVEYTFKAQDSKNYSVSIPGVGEGAFSFTKNLTIKRVKPKSIGEATVTTKNPFNTIYAWTGIDKIDQNKYTAGFNIELNESNVVLEQEPKTVTIAIDMRNRIWDWDSYYIERAKAYQWESYDKKNDYYKADDIYLRACKYAMLAIRSYVTEGKKFNVILPGVTPTALFPSPVNPTKENIHFVLQKLLASSPVSSMSTIKSLRAALSQSSDGIVIMVSDRYPPAAYINYNSEKPDTSVQGKLYARETDSLKVILEGTKNRLFTISDDYEMNSFAQNSGGYNLGYLLNQYFRYYSNTVDGSSVKTILPALFGNANPSGISNVKVDSPFDETVYSLEYQNRWGYSPMFRMMDMMPYYRSSNPKLYISGKSSLNSFNQMMKFVISGKMGGLGFTKAVTATTDYLPVYSAWRASSDVQFAFRKADYLADENWSDNSSLVKEIGKSYHIVTRQTSLLALEPGMTLWRDTLGNSTTTSTDASGKKIAAPSMADRSSLEIEQNGGINIDDITLESIAAGVDVNKLTYSKVLGNIFAAKFSRGLLKLSVPLKLNSSLSIECFDLKGRLIFSRNVDPSKIISNTLSIDLRKNRIAQGYYTLQIRSDKVSKRVTIHVTGK